MYLIRAVLTAAVVMAATVAQAATILIDELPAVYFNTGLDVARLVFSPNLSDPTADLAILARLTQFTGEDGRAALAGIALRRRPTRC